MCVVHPAHICHGSCIYDDCFVCIALHCIAVPSARHASAGALPGMLQERFYFGDTVLPLFESGIPLVQERIQRLPDAADITIAYPDEGAWKRFHSQFLRYPEVQ